jgi:8-oxo-dGTP pyrophosphatase MutT (NUDIX family)
LSASSGRKECTVLALIALMSEPIRPASTVILWRLGPTEHEILMGQRGAGAVFMPSKYVFPGGAVDPEDHGGDLASGWLSQQCASRLIKDSTVPAAALVSAARREVHEETGLTLGSGSEATLHFVFRAITPPGRSRRFDARFFLAPATACAGDDTGFADASGELSHLHWIALAEARALDLPFITEVVLAEVTALLSGTLQNGVPFFDNSGPVPTFRRLI